VPAEPPTARPFVAMVPPGLGYARAAELLRGLAVAGVPIEAVLAASDEGVLIANRIDSRVPVIDQVDVSAVAACPLVAVEVRAPGQPLTQLTDPVALAASFALGDAEAADAVTLCRSLVDYSNAVIGLAESAAGPVSQTTAAQPWVEAVGERVPLRDACGLLSDWPVGAIGGYGVGNGVAEVDDLFAVDLAAVADVATARRGSLGRSIVAASLDRMETGTDHAGQLAELLGCPVSITGTEPAAARRGALTTPGARPDAVVVDLGAGTIDVITPGAEIVAAGAGDLLTAAIAETLGASRAAAEWIKRGPCLRVDGGQRFEAEDGTRGFLSRSAPPSAAGTLAVMGPAGLLSFDRGRSPAEWRAVRLRLKQAVIAVNLRRALAGHETRPEQILIVGGPAADEELLGVLLRSLPDGVAAGRGNVGGTLPGPSPGHRYAAALGLAMAGDSG
jgi:hypothetical protein